MLFHQLEYKRDPAGWGPAQGDYFHHIYNPSCSHHISVGPIITGEKSILEIEFIFNNEAALCN
jgi:hypothetical protein